MMVKPQDDDDDDIFTSSQDGALRLQLKSLPKSVKQTREPK